jgi:hypothetical protein
MECSLKNVPLRLFRDYLSSKGLKIIRTKGGHEIWGGQLLLRPIVLQTHIDPIPEFIIRNSLRNLKTTSEDFINFCNNK